MRLDGIGLEKMGWDKMGSGDLTSSYLLLSHFICCYHIIFAVISFYLLLSNHIMAGQEAAEQINLILKPLHNSPQHI